MTLSDDVGRDPSGPGTRPGQTRTTPFPSSEIEQRHDGPRVPSLITLEGLSVGVAYPLPRVRTTIGRLEGNDLVLPSNPVSKHHAAIVQDDGLYFVEDLGSTNGVVVNGVPVIPESPRRLYHGDNIRISDHLFMFVMEEGFVDQDTGVSKIELDRDRIAEEARALIREAFGADPSSTSPPPERQG